MRDHAEIHDGTGTATAIPQPMTSLEFSDAELTVEDIMTETIVSAVPDEAVSSTIQKMARYKISCIIVTTGGRAVGILTERDVLRGVATRYGDFVRATVGEEMSHPVFSVGPGMTALAASALMESKHIKRLLIVSEQRPVGVVTQTDITRGLISMSPFKNIADLMTPDVVTVSETTTMTEAAQLMAARNISCVVLLRAGKAAGIITEKDILQRVAVSRDDPTTAPVAEIMSFPIVTVSPTYSVMSASRMMDQMHIHRLLVGSTRDIQGIVTQTDIIAAVRSKLEAARKARLQQKSEMSRLADLAMKNLSSIHALFRGILCHQNSVGGPLLMAEPPVNPPSHRFTGSDGDRDKAVGNDHILEELETHISEVQNNLERLARML